MLVELGGKHFKFCAYSAELADELEADGAVSVEVGAAGVDVGSERGRSGGEVDHCGFGLMLVGV